MLSQFVIACLLAMLLSVPLLMLSRWLRTRLAPDDALRLQRLLFSGIALSTLSAPLLHGLWTSIGESVAPVAVAVSTLRFDLLQPVLIEPINHAHTLSIGSLLFSLWLIGAVLIIALLVLGQHHFRQLAVLGENVLRADLPVHVPARVRVVRSVACHSAFVCGIWRPTIVLPIGLFAGNESTHHNEPLAAVLRHELAHLENHDTAWLPLCRFLLALCWPVLPLWFFYRDILLQSELAADAHALQNADANERRRYARHLVNAMQQPCDSAPGMPAFALRKSGSIKMRIRNILDHKTAASKSRKLIAAAALSFVLPLAGLQTVLAASGKEVAFISPLLEGTLTSTFGDRRNPFNGKTVHHNGVDIKAPIGTAILAPAKGEVVFAGKKNDNYGIVVEIQHLGGFRTVYAHLQSTHLKVGEGVAEGAEIGRVGVSGKSTGPHVHVEVYRRDQRVDPLQYLPLATLAAR
ncbi:M23/M56 family metallopeptidase [Permianibacter aggregans]|uniref:Murein DD-endopeptidase MepM/ murein hydrolase activator NlpD n=1 Tax=Permianibacter aggregans TaxID=1510150 RepID=A0A4R6UMP3_9GAMM|nr:M23/M56 family metallopeptidase [Permianibacter aggregans]QGX40213.1 hypothetical protein E2H98_11230 [Permianibacter aggregans]TDQ47466.1 murein DD-endopeptidase MepM/ murein hydrolase activator NlpD [Permianibacter aggregans]